MPLSAIFQLYGDQF